MDTKWNGQGFFWRPHARKINGYNNGLQVCTSSKDEKDLETKFAPLPPRPLAPLLQNLKFFPVIQYCDNVWHHFASLFSRMLGIRAGGLLGMHYIPAQVDFLESTFLPNWRGGWGRLGMGVAGREEAKPSSQPAHIASLTAWLPQFTELAALLYVIFPHFRWLSCPPPPPLERNIVAYVTGAKVVIWRVSPLAHFYTYYSV